MKQCSSCEITKSFENFCKDKYNKDGYHLSCRECNRLYRLSVKDKTKIYHAKKYKENKEKYKLKGIKWRTENPEKVKELGRKHYKDHAAYSKKQAEICKKQIHILYGGKCANIDCGDNREEVLTIDHVNNDGYIQRKIHKVGLQFYKWILKNKPVDLQLLCYNCNMVKEHKGRYPEKRLDICPDRMYHPSWMFVSK